MSNKENFIKAVTEDYHEDVVKCVKLKLQDYDDNLSFNDAEKILRECTVLKNLTKS